MGVPCQSEMRDTHEEQAVSERVTKDCAWCGKPVPKKYALAY